MPTDVSNQPPLLPPLLPIQAQADEPAYDVANQAIREIAEDDSRPDHSVVFDDEEELPPDDNNISTSTTQAPSSRTPGGVTHNGSQDSQSTTAETSDNMAIARPPSAQRVLNNVDTTARKKTRKKSTKQRATPRGAAIRKGKRVKVTCRALKYVIPLDAPAYVILDHQGRNDYNFYGTVLGPRQKTGKYSVRFDELPSEDNEYSLVRGSLAVLETGVDEPAYDHASEDAAEIAERCSGQEKAPKIKPSQDAIDAFLALSPEQQKSAKHFIYPYGPDANESISWKILEDAEEIAKDTMEEVDPAESPFKIDIPWDPNPSNVDYNKIFFDHFFPDLTGRAKVMDEFFKDVRAPSHVTVANDGITFDRPNHKDPDHVVSIPYFVTSCILLLYNSYHICLTQLHS